MKQNLKLFLFAICGIISIWLGFFAFDVPSMIIFYQNSVYWFLTISLFLWIITLIKALFYGEKDDNHLKKGISAFFKYHWIALLLSFILMVIGSIYCKPYFRVLSDESNLLSDAQSLYEAKECFLNISSVEVNTGGKDVFQAKIEKRPAFFQYLLCIIHSLTGYRAQNVFILNFISGFLSLFFFYYITQLLLDRFWGINALLCLFAYPLFIVYTNSAGFEVFNMMCSLVFFLSIYYFIKNPVALNAEVLFLWVPLLSQSRYESILAVLIAIPVIFYYLPKKEYEKLSYKFVVIPFLFIAPIWLRLITSNSYSWQVNNLEEGFGAKWFWINLEKSIEFYFSGKTNYGIVSIISYLAILGSLIFCWQTFIKKEVIILKDKEVANNLNMLPFSSIRIFWISVFVFYLLHALVRFFYSWIDLTNPIISRLGIIFLPLFIIMAIYFFVYINQKYNFNKYYILVISFFLIFYYSPNAVKMNNIGYRNYELLLEVKTGLDFLKTHFPNKREYIVIKERPNVYTPIGYSAVGFDTYYSFGERIKNYYNDKLCLYYLVFQTIDLDTNLPKVWQEMPEDLETIEVVFEKKLLQNHLLRISKCIPKNE